MKKITRSIILIPASVLFVSVLFSCNEDSGIVNHIKSNEDTVNVVANNYSDDDFVKRGEYLVTIAGCSDCHSPKAIDGNGIPYPDPEYLFSGHPQNEKIADYNEATAKDWILFNRHSTAVVGPWGVSYAANISSDPTGIGNWTQEQFIYAMKQGKYKGLAGSRTLLPPMPWPNYSKMTEIDLIAIYRYLKTTKPVSNVVPTAILNQ